MAVRLPFCFSAFLWHPDAFGENCTDQFEIMVSRLEGSAIALKIIHDRPSRPVLPSFLPGLRLLYKRTRFAVLFNYNNALISTAYCEQYMKIINYADNNINLLNIIFFTV